MSLSVDNVKEPASSQESVLASQWTLHWRHLAKMRIRTQEVGNLLDVFIVSAVGMILIIRMILRLTGYPQMGGRHLHIAHMLWGGLLMMASLILMQSVILPWARRVGAFIGGMGFGLFIDELGKFITRDNNYFFKPTFALIYLFFMIFYFGTRSLLRMSDLSPSEKLANAIEYLKVAAIHPLGEGEKQKALHWVSQSDPQNPYTEPVRALLEKAPTRSERSPFFWERWARWCRRAYLRWTDTPSFPHTIAALFFAVALLNFVDLPREAFTLLDMGSLGFSDWAATLSGAISTGLIAIGDYNLLRNQTLKAYRYFDRALRVAILVGQVFVFVQIQLKGILSLLLLLFLFVSLRYMIAQEERKQRAKVLAEQT
jgi:hypothetical protein